MRNVFIQGLNTVSGVVDNIAILANAVGTLVVLCLVLVVDYDVIARSVFNTPFRGAVEVVQFSMVLIVFLQLPDVVRVNRLTRSDGLLSILQLRYPRVARTVKRFIDSLSMLLMVLIAVAMWPEFLEMYETKDFFGMRGIFMAPWWPIKLIIFLSAALCAILFFFKVISLVNNISFVRTNDLVDKTKQQKDDL
jgi:TRAP-type C4-dicarboxylate transport system permease small subunit